ncbi:unnamed protein product [Lepeophtheirus salmonis]|uniref:(salmon louse) hypothetical protein n=1 Tax=Lepeophtheirus salmonis TaxID=72036 RepID=A0A7R8HBH4_LEPSM|nr:unnamed protein product [Lepeophtheirus salmonis]CAF2981370.1 unnamed protein product [Lepeophtheirus salmonis]
MERSKKRRSSILKSNNNDQTLRSENTEYIIGNPPAESTYVEPYTHDISSLRHTEDEDSKALSLPSSIDDEQSFCNKSIIYSPSHSDEPHGNGTLHQTADMDMTVFMSDTSDDQNDIENLIEQKANESFYKLFKEDSNNTMCHSTRMDMTVFQSNESKEENIESLIQEKAEESFALINSEKEVHFKYWEMETEAERENYNKPNNKNCTINVGVEMDLTTNECVMFEDPIEKDIRLYSEQEVVDPLIESIAQRKLPESHFHHKTDQNESTWKKKSKSISQVMIDKEENLENGSAKKYANPHKKRCLDYEVYDKENLHRTTQKRRKFEAVEMDLSADEDSVFLSTSKSDMGLCSKQEGVNVSKKSDSQRQLPEQLLNQVAPIESKGAMDIKNATKNSANDQSIIGHEDGLTKNQ